jgi:hypothetical protein
MLISVKRRGVIRQFSFPILANSRREPANRQQTQESDRSCLFYFGVNFNQDLIVYEKVEAAKIHPFALTKR